MYLVIVDDGDPRTMHAAAVEKHERATLGNAKALAETLQESTGLWVSVYDKGTYECLAEFAPK